MGYSLRSMTKTCGKIQISKSILLLRLKNRPMLINMENIECNNGSAMNTSMTLLQEDTPGITSFPDTVQLYPIINTNMFARMKISLMNEVGRATL